MGVGILRMNPVVNEGPSSMYFFIGKIRHLQILLVQPIAPEGFQSSCGGLEMQLSDLLQNAVL